MLTASVAEGEEGIRVLVRHWMALLAEDRYEKALEILYQDPEKRPGSIPSGGYTPHWTADELRTVVKFYGNYDNLLEEGEEPYRVVPITEATRQRFELWLRVEYIEGEATWGLDPTFYAGIVHVDLPLDVRDDYDRPSDVTARLFIRKIGSDQLALELYDAHVM
jgi:hypothetical protein